MPGWKVAGFWGLDRFVFGRLGIRPNPWPDAGDAPPGPGPAPARAAA